MVPCHNGMKHYCFHGPKAITTLPLYMIDLIMCVCDEHVCPAQVVGCYFHLDKHYGLHEISTCNQTKAHYNIATIHD